MNNMRILFALALLVIALALPANASNQMKSMLIHFDMDEDGVLSSSEMEEMVNSLRSILKLEDLVPEPKAEPTPEPALEPALEPATAKIAPDKEVMPEAPPEPETERQIYEKEVADARDQVVRWADEDEDGKISREEKQRASDALRGEIEGKGFGENDDDMAKNVLFAFNQDGSVGLSTVERGEAIRYIKKQYEITEAELKALQEKYIKLVDQDDDWFFSSKEKNRAYDLLRGTTQETDISVDLVSCFDLDGNGSLSTKERNKAMRLIEEYFKPVPLIAGEGDQGEGGGKASQGDTTAPLESELDMKYLASNFFDGHDGDLDENLTYKELVAALEEAQQDGVFRTRKLSMQNIRVDRVAKIRHMRAEIMVYFDRDKDETISREEKNFAVEALRGRIQGERIGEVDEKMVIRLVAAFDTDGSATISLKEREAAIKALMRHYSPVPLNDSPVPLQGDEPIEDSR